MKKILLIIVSLVVLFFIIGFIAVLLKWIDLQLYLLISTISGGVASVLGLLNLLRPALTPNDIQSLEVQALKKISEIAQEIEDAKTKSFQTKEEIAKLAEQKEEMQILVRKASLSLYLHDQILKHRDQILHIIKSNKDLALLLKGYEQISEKLIALDEEIRTDKNLKMLIEIEKMARLWNEPIDPITEAVRAFFLSFKKKIKITPTPRLSPSDSPPANSGYIRNGRSEGL